MAHIVYLIYQRFFDFFTGSERQRLFWLVCTFLLASIIWSVVTFKINIELDTLKTLFSSLIQALLALVALMGVMSVFKLQTISNEQSSLFQDVLNRTATHYSDLLKLKNYLTANPNPTNARYLERVESIEFSRRHIIDFTLDFTVYTFAVVLLNIVLLVFAPQIHSLLWSFPVVFIVFLLTAYSFFLVTKGIATSFF